MFLQGELSEDVCLSAALWMLTEPEARVVSSSVSGIWVPGGHLRPGALSIPRTLTPPLEAADSVLGLSLSQRPLQENKLSVLRGGGNSSLFKNRRGSPVAMTNFSCFYMFLKIFYFFYDPHKKVHTAFLSNYMKKSSSYAQFG